MPAKPTRAQIDALTNNDRRVLASVEIACSKWDGYAPHGAADWMAIYRLVRAGLVECIGVGICHGCDSAPHRMEPTEMPIYVLTRTGRARAAL